MQEIVKDFHDLCSSFPYEVMIFTDLQLFINQFVCDYDL